MLKPILISTLLLPLGAVGVDATPARAETMVSQRVSHADLDLTSEAGRIRLQQRIRWAARSVCGANTPSEPIRASSIRRCTNEAMDGAGRQVAVAVARAEGRKNSQLASR